MGVSVEVFGFRSPDLMTSLTRSSRARPIAPAGCREQVLPCAALAQNGHGQGIAHDHIAVVLEVGARLKGQASRDGDCSR